MAVAFAIFGVAFAAFGVWLGVRIVNRRERWAKWMATVMLVALLLYPLSAGPAWLLTRRIMARPAVQEWPLEVYIKTYAPLGLLADVTGSKTLLRAYVEWWAPKKSHSDSQ
jgi:multisubunit Na+/H+ antiporter MnhE subunit